MSTWLGLDIGGANLKAARPEFALSRPFPLWKQPEGLAGALRELLRDSPAADALAVTMTGELADGYETKREGVSRILRAVVEAAVGRRVVVYLTDGSFASPEEAERRHLEAAASNWHALARFAWRFVEPSLTKNAGRAALLVDIGSTTSDIVPIVDGEPATLGRTDPDRLVAGELVYTGVARSPVCAMASSLPWRGKRCPTAQELFSTALDAYVVLCDVAEDEANSDTADGRPATKALARDRLARSICADREMFSDEDALLAAKAIEQAQLAKLGVAAQGVLVRLPSPPPAVVIAGSGEFLARRLALRLKLNCRVVAMSEALGGGAGGRLLSRCATALAVAVLAQESGAA
ncbi:MAG: H4MPT-linked C1 transfer pathway protein [Planctomycetia bacterium]|nr:H4MPT-linked C1 transfer pathway protein [Planctomycetia bacterium]